jgi:hypothetical protein
MITFPRLTNRVIMDPVRSGSNFSAMISRSNSLGFAYRLDGVKGPSVHAVAGASDRSRHRSNRVTVTAERSRRQARLPGIAEMQREDREGSRHRFLRRQAGPDQLDDIARRAVMIRSINQANRPRDSPGDGLPGHPLASLLADFSSANPERRRLADGRASNAATDGGRHRCRTSSYPGVVRHLGRLDDKINKCIKIMRGDDQSNRSDPHCRPHWSLRSVRPRPADLLPPALPLRRCWKDPADPGILAPGPAPPR